MTEVMPFECEYEFDCEDNGCFEDCIFDQCELKRLELKVKNCLHARKDDNES